MKEIIDLNKLANRINKKQGMTDRAEKVSIALRRNSLLFTDKKNLWEYDFETHCFVHDDLQEKIQYLFKTIPISHTFKNEVMDFLPFLEARRIKDYDKKVPSEYGESNRNKNRKAMQEYFEENNRFVNYRIIYNNNYNEELREKYEIIYIE